MYWPIGAPSIYAAKIPPPATGIDYDSDESAELVRNSLSLSPAPAEDGDETDLPKETVEDEEDGRKVGEREVEDEESLPETPTAQDEQESTTSDGAQDDESRTHIVALRVARTGSLFATIARAELTIWQMKVRTASAW